MKIYVTDIGDSSVGIQELTIATLDIHESMVEVLEENNQMYSFKQEFKRLIDKYCAPEVSYDVFSDKNLEEEAKAEEEIMKEYCAGDVRATLEMYKNKPKMQTATGECEHPSTEEIITRPACVDGAISSRGFGEIPECPTITVGNSNKED